MPRLSSLRNEQRETNKKKMTIEVLFFPFWLFISSSQIVASNQKGMYQTLLLTVSKQDITN